MIEITKDYLKDIWPKRSLNSHKGTFGRVLIIAGNKQFGGAGILSATAAVYSGAGLVTLATDPINISAVRASLPEAMVIDYQNHDMLLALISNTSVVVIGPGLGIDETASSIFQFTLDNIPASTPLIIDGSAIDLLATKSFKFEHQPIIVTPHQMEWQRLSGIKIAEQQPATNQKLADKLNLHVVLKHPETEIYSNQKIYQIKAGNPGMATGGMGDTLTGILSTMICQIPNLSNALIAGTFLHSYTADLIYQTDAVVIPHRLSHTLPKTLKKLMP